MRIFNVCCAHTHTNTERERERERQTHTHRHTHPYNEEQLTCALLHVHAHALHVLIHYETDWEHSLECPRHVHAHVCALDCDDIDTVV